MHIAIIGGGPAGLFTATLLARQGYAVDVYEEHKVVGNPIQCTGLLTEDILELLPNLLESGAVVNTTTALTATTKNETMQVRSKELVVDRTRFDQYIAKLARQAGARIHTGHRFQGQAYNGIKIRRRATDDTITITPDILIGADGPLSKTARTFFPNNTIPLYHGVQAVMHWSGPRDVYDTYLGDEFPEFFGWVVPQGKKQARIGLAAKKDAMAYFDRFLVRLALTKDDIIGWQAGPIPVFNPKNLWHTRTNAMDIMLVGDAAGQIKSTTGGGIYMGMRCAQLLAHCIKEQRYQSYLPSLRHAVVRELYAHLLVREVLDRFDDKDYDKLVKLLSSPTICKEFSSTSRDQATRLMLRIAMRRPDIIRYAPRAMRAGIRIIW